MKVRSWDLIFYTKDSSSTDVYVYGELHMDNNSDYKVYALRVSNIDSLYGIDEQYIEVNSKKSLYTSYLKQFL